MILVEVRGRAVSFLTDNPRMFKEADVVVKDYDIEGILDEEEIVTDSEGEECVIYEASCIEDLDEIENAVEVLAEGE